MNRFRSVLAVYADVPGADDVLVQAVDVARTNGANLTVVSTSEFPRSAPAVHEARRRLTRIVPWIVQQGVCEVATDVLSDTPHVEVIRRVQAEGHDLVVTSAEAGRTIKDAFCGSTVTNLMLKCPAAVWALKPGRSVPCSNIMAALNPRLDDPCDDLNAKILDVATSLARAQDACLHVVHFWDVDGKDGETLRSEITREIRQRILDKHEARRRRAVNALLTRCRTSQIVHEIHLPRGRPGLHLAGFAERLAMDLIVMGTACRLGISRILMRNFAEMVLGGVRCSLLTVKPDGFGAPVALPQEETPPAGLHTGGRVTRRA